MATRQNSATSAGARPSWSRLCAGACSSARTPFEHVHVTYFAAVREALELDDVDLPVRLALGAIVAGDLPAVHAWEGAEEALVPRPLGLDYDDLPHAQWNTWLAEDLERRAQSQSGAEAAAALWARTQEELDLGRCDGLGLSFL